MDAWPPTRPQSFLAGAMLACMQEDVVLSGNHIRLAQPAPLIPLLHPLALAVQVDTQPGLEATLGLPRDGRSNSKLANELNGRGERERVRERTGKSPWRVRACIVLPSAAAAAATSAAACSLSPSSPRDCRVGRGCGYTHRHRMPMRVQTEQRGLW